MASRKITKGGRWVWQGGDKESASIWREFLQDLEKRGLDGSEGLLGMMDGLPGLEKAIEEEFTIAADVLAKVPRKSRKASTDEMRSIFDDLDMNVL